MTGTPSISRYCYEPPAQNHRLTQLLWYQHQGGGAPSVWWCWGGLGQTQCCRQVHQWPKEVVYPMEQWCAQWKLDMRGYTRVLVAAITMVSKRGFTTHPGETHLFWAMYRGYISTYPTYPWKSSFPVGKNTISMDPISRVFSPPATPFIMTGQPTPPNVPPPRNKARLSAY